jgi:hypothetical protein
MYFFETERTMFKGRSPRGRVFPTGVTAQPLGRWTLFDAIWSAVWENTGENTSRQSVQKDNFFM